MKTATRGLSSPQVLMNLKSDGLVLRKGVPVPSIVMYFLVRILIRFPQRVLHCFNMNPSTLKSVVHSGIQGLNSSLDKLKSRYSHNIRGLGSLTLGYKHDLK